jgi:hypothetical protein
MDFGRLVWDGVVWIQLVQDSPASVCSLHVARADISVQTGLAFQQLSGRGRGGGCISRNSVGATGESEQ